ncbi:UNVERIFIED_CONTAM: Retrovirus-related Pol polyprotein from type-1 retrotransposable element R2 [Sesamum radiatum]|uniref:Retrovirus-related Pol polyprotein from type-1 retrotransposable element R2 n=1 Tax=Sesamum radiatum TaxID=300843 RepID=A0AAW2PLT2_SESRA
MAAFPRARATNLMIGGSDHCIVQISLDQMGIQGSHRRPKRFRFEAAWLREPSCEEVIQAGWKSVAGSEDVGGVSARIRSVRVHLLQWERREFGNVRSRIRQLEDRILSLDKGNLSTDSKQLLEMMKSELEELLAREELLWKQRSKAEWLREGDKNTAYFHARANERRKRNMISSLQSEEGCFTSDREKIQDIILRHFKTVYSSTNPDLSVMEAILNTINPRVTGKMNEALLQPFSPEEVKRALDQMPISLCNVIYKLASKTIANRIKPFLNGIISSSQSAFIPGRLITDNVLVAYELNHYLAHKRWGSMGHVALKLDISKAYDRVEWVFLERALLKLGFHSEFAKLIMSCVNSVSYSIMLESEPFGFIRPERGLRQGDPLSPYLFLFCAEAFSCMIQKEEREGNIQGVAVCRKAREFLIYCSLMIRYSIAKQQLRLWIVLKGFLLNLRVHPG